MNTVLHQQFSLSNLDVMTAVNIDAEQSRYLATDLSFWYLKNRSF